MNLLGVIRKNWGQLLTICGIFALMIVLSCLWAVSNARQYMTLNAEEMLQVAEERLQGRIRESEVTLFNTANSLIQQQLHRGFNAEETREYLREIHRELSHSEYNLGYFNIFWYMPRPEGMVFISGSDWEPPPEYEPEKRPWYFAADAIPGHSAITAPYIEWKEGINAVTMALRLRGGGGEDFGILGIDLSVARLAQFALSFQFERGGYGYLIGPSLEPDKLCFIAYPDSRYAGLPMRGLGPQYAALEERLKQGTEALSSVTLKNANNVPVIAFYRRTINGWYMGLAFPRDGYFHDLYVNIFVFVLSGIVLMLVLCYFIVNLSMDKLQSDEENQAKSSFLAQVSHEIRTPLNSILGMSEIILRKDISPDLYENVSIIRQSGDILLSIINNILDFSRIEIHRIQIENHPYQLSSMINDVVNIIRLGLAGKPVDFFVDVAGDIPVELLGDEAKVRQLLINLLNNAVKYTRQGYIKLLVRKGAADSDELRLLFSVEDTGIGIRQEDLGRLFRDFTRLDRERNSHIEGAGLGLAIAASFCKALGGGISVESVYGEGSIFTAEVRQGVGKGGTTLQLRESGMRVVVYEDRSLYLEFLLRAFNALGIDPESSPDLSSFVSALEGGDFDYAFVASRYAADCVAAWEGAASPAKLFVMAETDFDAGFRSAGRVHLPLYSCSLANILNGVPGPENNSRRTDRFAFMAPDARVLVVDDLSTNLRVAEELMR
ncbi:MAG: histidine kinase, partial [Spirochaetaceae bacterium]|nr:histidine kinase [Spirochaetaceae bacterium]